MITDPSVSDKSAKELQEKNSLLEATFNSIVNGILIVNTQGKIVIYNRRFVEMWGIPEEILETKDGDKAMESILGQMKDPDAFVKKVRELYSTPESESHDVLEFKDGRVFERYSKPQRIEDKIIGRVWSFLDVSEYKRIERELSTHTREFESLNKELKDTQVAMADFFAEQKTNEGKLLEKNTELKEMNGLMIDRELKMIELKKEIQELKNKLGEA